MLPPTTESYGFMSDDIQQPKKSPRFTVTLGGSQWAVATYGTTEYLRSHRLARAVAAILGVCLALVAVASFLGFKLKKDEIYSVPLMIIVVPWLLWVATISGPDFQLVFPDEQAKKETEQALEQFEASNTPEDALNLDFKRLNEYYVINQSQARSSFRWAIFSMFIGFGTIVAGIWLFYFRHSEPDKFMASLTTAAGCVVNVISALFLYLHSKTQERSLVYYDQLTGLQKLILAIRLVSEHKDPDKQTEARNQVIRELLEGAKGRK
jgi:hypothetical protein